MSNQESIDGILVLLRPIVVSLCKGAEVEDDTDLFQMGLLSSLYALRLVESVERSLDLTVPNSELKMTNFRSLRAIAQMVFRIKVSP
jgi:methoxymalonate biosynthesis acyl carrier protein